MILIARSSEVGCILSSPECQERPTSNIRPGAIKSRERSRRYPRDFPQTFSVNLITPNWFALCYPDNVRNIILNV